MRWLREWAGVLVFAAVVAAVWAWVVAEMIGRQS